MTSILNKTATKIKRQRLLERLKSERPIKFELVVDTTPIIASEDDDGLTIPDFRKSLHR